MKVLNSLIMLASVVSLPALATSGITSVPGEIGFDSHAMPSMKSRAEVVNDLDAWKRSPVSIDGWREVGGEAGWVYVGTGSPGRTRAAVIAETIQAMRDPVSVDGWRDVGGEAGVVFVGVPSSTRNAANAATPSQASDGDGSGRPSRNGHRSGMSAGSNVYRR